MSKANKTLLNARVRRTDGTITYINKVNANGYSTAAKGPQIPVKRIVFAGKTLKEIEAPFTKGEYVIVQGVAVKLNKSQQRELAAGTLDEKALRPDFSRLTILGPETGKATDGKEAKADKPAKVARGLKATKVKNGEAPVTGSALAEQVEVAVAAAKTIAQRSAAAEAFGVLWKELKTTSAADLIKSLGKSRVRKALKALSGDNLDKSVDVIEERKAPKDSMIDAVDATIAEATTKERRQMLSEAFDMDWRDVKRHGGRGVLKHLGRKGAQSALDKLSASVSRDTFIKQMPTALKRLIQDRHLTLNKKQIEVVLEALGLDTKFYSIATQTLLGNLSLAVDAVVETPKSVKTKAKAKPSAAKPVYATEKENKRRVKKMKYKLLAPSKADMKAAKAHLKQAKQTIADKLGITTKEVTRGLIVHSPKADYMFVACDVTGAVFIDANGAERVLPYATLANAFDMTLTPQSELDVAV